MLTFSFQNNTKIIAFACYSDVLVLWLGIFMFWGENFEERDEVEVKLNSMFLFKTK